ncbi:hypothetical protein ACFRCI_39565 [Streptomyces sp. NPDC056638]|uniref:hypothetical protein n=1 Tax=Streptomyces sp. NPDC056638 TaxID=3345887 RepID=UPI0036B42E01
MSHGRCVARGTGTPRGEPARACCVSTRSRQGATGHARIVSAAGRTTPRTVFDCKYADALAEIAGCETTEFPGGHNGNTSHPRQYAARLREVLLAN